MANVVWPWAIILCKFNDRPNEPQPRAYYEDLYTRNGTGQSDYWRAVSSGSLDLTTSRVFGWFVTNHASTEVSGLTFPAGRSTLVQWGVDVAAANGVNLGGFKAVLVVQN